MRKGGVRNVVGERGWRGCRGRRVRDGGGAKGDGAGCGEVSGAGVGDVWLGEGGGGARAPHTERLVEAACDFDTARTAPQRGRGFRQAIGWRRPPPEGPDDYVEALATGQTRRQGLAGRCRGIVS